MTTTRQQPINPLKNMIEINRVANTASEKPMSEPEPFYEHLKSEHRQDFEAIISIEKPVAPCQSYQGIVVFLAAAF